MASLSLPSRSARPVTVIVAAALSVLVLLGNLSGPLFPSGPPDRQVPAFVIVVGLLLALVGIVAVIGLWLLRRWGAILTYVVVGLNLLLTLPGIVGAPYGWARVLSAVTVLISVAIIVQAAHPAPRRACR